MRITKYKSWLNIFCFLVFWGAYFPSFGAVQNIVISGLAYRVVVDTTANSYKVFAGYNGTTACSGRRDGVSLCNSCEGQTGLVPCNKSMVYPEGRLRIAFQTTATGNNLSVAAKVGSTVMQQTDFADYSAGSISASSEVYVEFMWSTLCKKVLNLEETCIPSGGAASSASGTLTVGVSSTADASSLTESFNVAIQFNYVPQTASLFTPCDPGVALTGDIGACSYKVFPGDGKVYIYDVLLDTTSGKSAVTGHGRLGGIALLYAQTPSITDPTTIQNMQLTNSLAILEVDGSSSTTTSSSSSANEDEVVEFVKEYIDSGLENGLSYCFLLGNMDDTGNIFNFMNPLSVNGSNVTNYCATPQQVVGVLDGKKCFIATAAFGSSMAAEVDLLRGFRDKFLLKSGLGRKFVKEYYTLSPPLARWIAKRDGIRALVRFALWPVVFFAKLSIKYGLMGATILLLLFFMGMILFLRMFWIWRRKVLRIAIPLAFIFLGNQESAWSQSFDDLSEPPRGIADEMPQEPPYVDNNSEFSRTKIDESDIPVKTFDQVDGGLRDSAGEAVLSSSTKNKVSSDLSDSQTMKKSGDRASSKPFKEVEFRSHPFTKKGLQTIEPDGTFVYKVKEKVYSKSSTFRFGLMDPPAITGPDGSSFSDYYGTNRMSFFLYDYEWQPFVKFGKIGLQMGFGLFSANGHGRFYPISTALIPREKFTFYGLPINAGLIYRFEVWGKQWLAPYFSGGGSYYIMAETREDRSSAKFAQSAALYGGMGLLLSISRLDSRVRFSLLNDYGIGNLWLNFEYRYQQGINQGVDLTGSLFAIGMQADY